MAIIIVVYHYDRGQEACSQAGDGFESEFHVLCCFARLDAEMPLDGFNDLCYLLNVAGGSAAALYGVSAVGGKVKLLIEGDDAIYLALGDAGPFAKLCKYLSRQIAVCVLYFLEQRDQVGKIGPGPFGEYLIEWFKIGAGLFTTTHSMFFNNSL